MAGRRPKPTHLKVVTGNPGKRKLNDKEPAPVREIPSPPAHLTDWGKVAWGKLTVLLDGMGVLTVADTLALERLCDIYADILQLRLTIADEGRTYTVQTDDRHNPIGDVRGDIQAAQITSAVYGAQGVKVPLNDAILQWSGDEQAEEDDPFVRLEAALISATK